MSCGFFTHFFSCPPSPVRLSFPFFSFSFFSFCCPSVFSSSPQHSASPPSQQPQPHVLLALAAAAAAGHASPGSNELSLNPGQLEVHVHASSSLVLCYSVYLVPSYLYPVLCAPRSDALMHCALYSLLCVTFSSSFICVFCFAACVIVSLLVLALSPPLGLCLSISISSPLWHTTGNVASHAIVDHGR